MHDAPPLSYDAPAPPVEVDHGHHHHHNSAPPDEPPPPYDDATGSGTAPLLVGAPPGYGTIRAFSDASSGASSELETTDRSLPEWVGQALVVFVFLMLIYGFWRVINAPDNLHDYPG